MVVKREDMIFEKIAPVPRSLKHQIENDPILLQATDPVVEQIPHSISENFSSVVRTVGQRSSSELRTQSPIPRSVNKPPVTKGKRGRKKKTKPPLEQAHHEEFVDPFAVQEATEQRRRKEEVMSSSDS